MKLITTSWDDGHVLDFRLAELLDKYALPATFYIPASNHEHEVMSESQVVELSDHFEIGGHTMLHKRIVNKSEIVFKDEIQGCYHWLTQILGTSPVSFCFPGGVYNKAAILYAFKTGFKIIRTTELLNPTFADVGVLPTTLQLYPHTSFTYQKHLLKRLKFSSLLLYWKSNRSSDILKMVEYYLQHINEHGGCFHLWGHSWEIEEFNLWSLLEEVLKELSGIPEFQYATNGKLLQYQKTLSMAPGSNIINTIES